jgi:hypothetical protein
VRERLEGSLFRANSNGEEEEEMKARVVSADKEDEKREAIEPEQTRPEHAGSPSAEQIRQRAYEIHLERGGVHGRDQDDWLEAERDLTQKYRTDATGGGGRI